jgi:hypothetical protein
MQKKLTILEVEDRISKKTGTKFRVAQCIVHGDTIRVGELMIFGQDIAVSKGDFNAHFELDVNFDKQVGAKLVALVPVSPAGKISPPPNVS